MPSSSAMALYGKPEGRPGFKTAWTPLRRLPGESRGRYEEAAVKILRTIADSRADFGQGCDAIVQNCSAAYHSPEHHFTMSYADYYFIEAMYKVKGVGRLLW